MPEVLTRADWSARSPKTTPTKVSWYSIDTVDLHWPGSVGVKIGTDKAAVARWLRSWQNYHMDSKGWNDIAYNVAVDLAGRVWMLRGWGVQDGGVSGLKTDVTVLAVMGSDDKATDAMKRSILWCFAEFENLKGGGLRRTYHGALQSTSCPGPELTAWARAGFPPPPLTTTQEDDMALTDDDLNRIAERVHRYPIPRQGSAASEGTTDLLWEVGFMPHNFRAVIETSAAVRGEVSALGEAVRQLAGGQDIDLDAIREAARRGVADAVASIETTVTVKEA